MLGMLLPLTPAERRNLIASIRLECPAPREHINKAEV